MPRPFVPLAGAALAACALVVGCSTMGSGSKPMSFFVTSANPGKGGDLGGLAGADRFCHSLATSAGAGSKTWRAYLSTAESGQKQGAFSAESRSIATPL